MSRHYLWTSWPLGKGNTGQAGQQEWTEMAMATATVLLRLLASEELKMGREGTRGDRIGQDRDAARQTLVDCASAVCGEA
jgi:hypothetical protein